MTALEKLRDWIATYPGYNILADFQVDFTDQMTANSGGIFPSGLVPAFNGTNGILVDITFATCENVSSSICFCCEPFLSLLGFS